MNPGLSLQTKPSRASVRRSALPTAPGSSWHSEIVSALSQAAISWQSPFELAQALSGALDKTRERLLMDDAYLLTLDSNGVLSPLAEAHSGRLSDAWVKTTCNQCFRGMAVYEGHPITHPNLRDDLWKRPCSQEKIEFCSCMPFKSLDSTVGVLHFISKKKPVYRFWESSYLTTIGTELGAVLTSDCQAQEVSDKSVETRPAGEQLAQSERMVTLGRMASGVAHDINNNLAAILMNAQLLLKTVTDEEARNTIQVIERAALDGALTVRRIQEFAKASSEQHFVRVDLNQIVKDVVAITRPRWRNEALGLGKRIILVTDLPKLPPVAGNPSELRDAFTNIVINAIDSMPSGGTITLKGGVNGDSASVSVSDTGEGMTDEVRRRIFEPFFSTKGPRGTGLGMSLAYGIITRHRGRIDVQSEPAQGTTITVSLPVDLEAQEAPRETLPPAQISKKRVLVVEDESNIRDAIAEILGSAGHTVVAAGDGSEAVKSILESSYDMVLTDLAMPGELSGWDVASAAKKRRQKTLVALMTGWGVLIDKVKLQERGVDHLLPKPFGANDILKLIAQPNQAKGRNKKPLPEERLSQSMSRMGPYSPSSTIRPSFPK